MLLCFPEKYVEIFREQAPRTLTRFKLDNAIAEEYCKEHGIELTEYNLPQEVKDATQKYFSGLLKSHKNDIVFYIDKQLEAKPHSQTMVSNPEKETGPAHGDTDLPVRQIHNPQPPQKRI